MTSHHDLVEEILGSVPGTVVVVVAPGGYGKSTLLDALAGATAIARIELRSHHNDPARFARDLLFNLDGDGAPSPPPGSDLVGLIRDRMALASTRCLVFDDVHVVDDPTVINILGEIAWRMTDGFVVMASRHSPPIGVSALKVKRRLLEIDERDLALTDEQAAELVESVGGVAAAGMLAPMRGWPAGLVLLGLASRQGNDMRARYEFEFDVQSLLREDILIQLENELRTFTLELAAMAIFNPDVVGQVTGRAGAREMLQELISRHLFIIPTRTAGWLRFHDIVGEGLLRQAGADLGRTRMNELQVGIVGALMDRGEYDLANEAMVAVGDPASLSPTLARVGQLNYAGTLIARCEITNLARLYGRIPVHDFDHNQSSLVMALTVAIIHADAPRADALLREMRLRLGDQALSTHEPTVNLRGLFCLLTGDLDSAVSLLLESRRLVEVNALTPDLLYLAIDALPVCELLRDNLDAAESAAREAIELGARIGAKLGVAWVEATLGLLSLWRGDATGAAEHLERAQRGAELSFSPQERPFVAALHSGLLSAQGEHEHARGLAIAALSHPSFPVRYVGNTLALLTLAEAEVALGLTDEATARLGQVALIMERSTGAHLPQRLLRSPRLQPLLGLDKRTAAPTERFELSASERKILPLLQSRLTLREIASELYLSVNTVKTHTQSIYRKLGVSSRDEATALFGLKRAG